MAHTRSDNSASARTKPHPVYDVLIVGAGSIGVSVAWHLLQRRPDLNVILVDRAQPLSLTSATSGENFRNWWPHSTMKQFMDRSMDILKLIEQQSGHSFIDRNNGYLLATRDDDPRDLITGLESTYSDPDAMRWHHSAGSYQSLTNAADGVDVVDSSNAASELFPTLDPAVKTLVHIRRGGSIATQELGNYMLGNFKFNGGSFFPAEVTELERNAVGRFAVTLQSGDEEYSVQSETLVNCAGPFAQSLSQMLGISLPVTNVLQQKIAFDDHAGAVDRSLPFCIDLDGQCINWSETDRQSILEDPELGFLAALMPGSIHCRPDGAQTGTRIKLGWAYNETPTAALLEPALDDHFPEVVLRGASRLHPALSAYYDGFPKQFTHYGGYYTMTEENWPLIGGTDIDGYFIATALSGFGSMAACATGELIASHVLGERLPGYAADLSLQRYDNLPLVTDLRSNFSRGIL